MTDPHDHGKAGRKPCFFHAPSAADVFQNAEILHQRTGILHFQKRGNPLLRFSKRRKIVWRTTGKVDFEKRLFSACGFSKRRKSVWRITEILDFEKRHIAAPAPQEIPILKNNRNLLHKTFTEKVLH